LRTAGMALVYAKERASGRRVQLVRKDREVVFRLI
jgi:hypothetical protein